MNILYIYQNTTYKQESSGGFLWDPQKTTDGSKNKGDYNMSTVKKGILYFMELSNKHM